MNYSSRMSVAAAMVLAAGACVSADVVAGLPEPTNQLLRMYPGTDVIVDQGRVQAIYGAPMTPGLTPEGAVQLFLQQHVGALGAGNADLRTVWATELGNGRHTVFAFEQWMDGMPVEHGAARVLVLKGPVNRVVYAAGTLAPHPEGAWPNMTIDGNGAVAQVKKFKQYSKLPVFSKPELVVYQGEGGWSDPVRAWKFTAEEPNLAVREKWTFFVDAATKSLIHVRNEVLNDELAGSVKGMASPGLLPDETSNPAVLTALPLMRVGVVGGSTAYSTLAGAYTLGEQGTDPVQVSATVGTAGGSGRWVSVDNKAGAELIVTQAATPGTAANLVFNNPPGGANSATTSQVNAFIHTTKIHNFYRDRSGTWDLIDVSLRANVNVNDTCNANFDGSAINFYATGGGCVNTAYSDVIAHEYGHFVVQSLGLGQGGFGEGFADCGALLSLDGGPILGRDFSGPGSFVRNVQTANQQYPCSNPDPHVCGQILGGVWWGIRGSMGTFYGSTPGLTKTQQLFVDWMQVTIGGTGSGFSNSANPTTAVEILTINDDDGVLANGTPDYARICPNFTAHGIACPAAPPLGFQFPNGLPTLIPSNTAGTILVNVIPMASTPVANTGKIDYRINGGSYTEVAMSQVATNQYRATIPAQPCNTNVEYYFKATATTPPNTTVTSPLTAPADKYYVPVADAILTEFTDSFETDQGWSGASPEDTATTGRWERAVPHATAAQPGSDHTPTGSVCWVTGAAAGQQVSDFDVDGGQTTLTSPLFNLAGKLSPRISFWLWYSNNVGPTNPGTNIFVVDITNDDGVSWHRALTVGPTGAGTTGGWVKQEFAVLDILPLTATMRVRMIASDYTDSIVEAAVDDFLVTSLQCPPPFCYANCDQSTIQPILNVNDFTCFLNRFAAGDTYANCDNSTTAPVLNVLDFNCFLNRFSSGCP